MNRAYFQAGMKSIVAAAVGAIAATSSFAQEQIAEPVPPTAAARLQLVVGAEGTVEGGVVVPQVIEIADSPGTVRMSYAASGGDDWQHMLHSEQIQKELELADEQRVKLRQVAEEHQAEMQRIFSQGRRSREGDPPLKPEDYGKRMRELQTAQRQKVEEILLPHQRKRIGEIALRTRLNQRGTVGTLADKELAKQLEISEEQQTRLRKKSQDVQAELERKIAKLRDEAREEILEELTISQRQKLKEMLGAEFEHRPEPFRPRPAATPRLRAAGEPRQ